MTFDEIQKDLRGKINEFLPVGAGIYATSPKIIYTLDATKDSKYRLFKNSKHRSKRVWKKLRNKHNGFLFRQEPCAYRNGDTLFIHPALEADLRSKVSEDVDRKITNSFYPFNCAGN